MSTIPRAVLIHQVQVEPYAGRSSRGPIYGAPFTLRCLRQGGNRLVRASDGTEQVASVTLYALPGQADKVPAGSRVTYNGRTTTVMAAVDHDSGKLGAPDHTEVTCQ